MDVSLSRAIADDLPTLAELNLRAYFRETATQFAFTAWPDERAMRQFFTARVKERLHNPNTQVFKAAIPNTGEVVGFACWVRESKQKRSGAVADANEPVAIPTPTASVMSQMPEGMNIDFVTSGGAQVEGMQAAIQDPEYFYLTTFVVTPKWQNKGVGSQLLRHCLDLADAAQLPTWLISFPGSHPLYLRFAFQDVDHVDTDLNAWDRYRFRGYGIYRSYLMRRSPGVHADH